MRDSQKWLSAAYAVSTTLWESNRLTALKTVSMYLRSAKTEAEEAGESTEGMVTSVSKLRNEILSLTNNKVDMQIDEDTYKSTTQILRELAGVWEELTDLTKANILEKIGGKRNSNVTSALIENFDIVEKVIETSSRAAGSALAENEKVLDSIQGKINVFKASFEALSSNVISGDFVKFVVTAGTAILNLISGITKLVSALGGLRTILIFIIGLNAQSVISGLINLLSKLGSSKLFLQIKANFKSLKSDMLMLKTGLDTAGKTATAEAMSMAKFNVAATAITAVLGVASMAWSIWSQKQEEARQKALDAVNTFNEQNETLKQSKATLDEISERYAELSKGVNSFGYNMSLTTGEYEEYINMTDQIAQMFPELIKGYNDEGTAILSCKGSVEELTKAYNDAAIAADNKVLVEAPTLFKEFKKEAKKLEGAVWWADQYTYDKEKNDILKKMLKAPDIEAAINDGLGSGHYGGIAAALHRAGIEQGEQESYRDFIARAIKSNRRVVETITTDFDSQMSAATANMSNTVAAYIDKALKQDYSNWSVDMKNVAEQISSNLDFDLLNSFDNNGELFTYIDSILNQINSLSLEDQNTIKVGFDLQTSFNNGDCSVGEYLSWSEKIETLIGGFDEKTQNVFRLMFDIDEDGIKNKYDKVLAAIGDKNKNWLSSLKSDDLEILFNISVKENTDGWSLEDWKNKLSEYKTEATQAATDIEQSVSDVQSAIEGISKIQEVINGQKSGLSISVEDLNSDELKDYKDALELVNGAIQLNTDKVDDIIKKKTEEQIAIVNTNKTLEQSKYIENARKIEEYRQKLEDASYAEGETADSIHDSINALLEENSTIADNCEQYDMLTIALKEATGAYQHWINAQNSSDYGDMADSTISAIKQINDTYDSDSEIFGNFGSKKFQAAVDLVVPDSVDQDDLSAIESYMRSFKQYLKFDEDGNAEGLDVDKFLSNGVKAGLLKYSQDTGFEVAGEKSVEDFAKGLNMSEDMVRAFFDELQLKGASFDWSTDWSDGEKTIGDLAVEANEAAEALRKIEGNKGFQFKIDVSDIEKPEEQIKTLETTISDMQRLKAKVNVSSEEVEHANSVIAYCLKQKQLLSQPDIMRVDTSKVEGDIGSAIKLLQQFSEAQNNLELELAVGADTSETQKEIDNLTGKIKNLNPDIKAKLSLDTTNGAESIKESISKITAESLTVNAKINAEAVEGYNPESKTCDVIYDPKTDLLPKSFGDMHCNVIYDAVTKDLPTKLSTLTRWVHYKAYGDTQEGDHSANGTAHATGTAKAGGNWGTAPGGKTLVGELGREIVVNVHTGRWYTVGDHGAEFVTIPQDAIIFNHLQSESLLENGYIYGRGKAMASGTAYGQDIEFNYKPYVPSNTGNTSNNSSNTNTTKTNTKTTKTDKTEEIEFEKQYKKHQHLVAMEQETEHDYLIWLNKAYKEAYAKNQISLDDYRKYQEEVYKGLKDYRSGYFTEQYNKQKHYLEMGQKSEASYYNWVEKYAKKAYEKGWLTEEEYWKYQEEAYQGQQKLAQESFDKEVAAQKHKVAMGKMTNSAYYDWLESRIDDAYKKGLITLEEYRSFQEEIKKNSDDENKQAFQSQVDDHNYKMAMDQETPAEYYKWLKENNLNAYKNGQIDKAQYRKNREEIFKNSRDTFVDKIDDRNFQIEQLAREEGNEDKILKLRQQNIDDINRRLESARKYGLDESDDWVQQLIGMRNTQEDETKSTKRGVYDKEIKKHQHDVAMGKETDQEYFEWFKKYSEDAYKKGIIDQEEYWSNLETLRGQERGLLTGAVDDRNFQIDQLSREDGNENKILELYKLNADAAKEALDKAKNEGLDDTDEWVQQLTEILNNAENGIKQTKHSLYDKELEEHKHNVAMGKETEAEYFEWFKVRNEELFKDGTIDKSEYWSNLESLYDQEHNLFKDSLNDKEFKVSNLEAEEADAKEIVTIYEGAISDIEKEIEKAYAYGLDENDEWVQYLIGKLNDYKKNVKDTTKEIADNAKDAMDKLVDYQENIIKQNLEDQKDALQKKLNATKEYYDKRKEYLQNEYDQDTYLKEQKEKRKDVTDVENKLKQLENDDSAWASKRRLELQEQLSEAKSSLDEFEKKKSLDTVLESIDKLYEQEEEQTQKQIDAIDEVLNDPYAIYNMALSSVKNNTDGIYAQMLIYNRKHGTGNDDDVKEIYEEASKSLSEYEKYYGKKYDNSGSDDELLDAIAGTAKKYLNKLMHKGNSSGYASGTSNATAGIHRLYEEGYEQIFSSKDGRKYKILNRGDMVLDADKTRFLFNFAQSKGSIFADVIRSLGNSQRNISNNRMQNIDISTGDIVVNGNTNDDTVSQIRREQRSQVDFMLRELKKLNSR